MTISNWSGRPKVQNAQLRTYDKEKLPTETFCPRGSGRNYGDVSLQQTMVSTLGLNELLLLREDVLEVSAGITVGQILNFIVPKGFLLPVIPGTQFVTVGGLIAADVHGKNHEQNGTIGRWIESLEVQFVDGQIQSCDRQNNSELFETTVGGLGLTGIVIAARIKLIPLATSQFKQRTQVYNSVNLLLEALWNSPAPYKTGWFDFFQMDHCLLFENEPETHPEDLSKFVLPKPKITIRFRSVRFVRTWTMRVYNRRYFRNAQAKKERVSLDAVLFPLDRIENWNYLYGTRGFHQLQWSFEREGIALKLERIFHTIQESKQLPVLSVIKKHGALESPGMLSFPKEGFSFAFDFIHTKDLEALIQKLHTIIAEEGGRIYLVKDALLHVSNFEKMYPEAPGFRKAISKYNSGTIASLLSKRLNLTS